MVGDQKGGFMRKRELARLLAVETAMRKSAEHKLYEAEQASFTQGELQVMLAALDLALNSWEEPGEDAESAFRKVEGALDG